MRKNFKLTLVALSLLALTACSAEHEINIPTPQGDEISFGTVNTRAGLSDLQRDGFAVWGVHFNTAHPYGYLLFDNVSVTYNGSDWVYSPIQRWLPNTTFNFMAAYPADAGFKSAVYEEEYNDGVLKLNYVVLDDYSTANQSEVIDLLGASAVVDTSVDGYSRTVPLTFNHLLCRINVCIMQDGEQNREDNFIIDKVTLSGVQTTGDYVFYPVGNIDQGWIPDKTKTTDYSNTFTDNEHIGLTGKRYLSEDALFMIPQKIGAEQIKLTINFRFGAQGTDGKDKYESKVLEAYLPADVDGKDPLWQSGKSITYNVKVSTYNPITFLAPTVSSWGNLQSGGTIIIK